MEKWILLALTTILQITESLDVKKNCEFHLSIRRWPQLTCTDVTTDFFEKFDLQLNRTHWLKCNDCILNVLNEKTFNFPRNNISIIELLNSDIRIIKKFTFNKFLLLKTLILRNNSIGTLEPKCFSSIKRLIQLDLSTNSLRIITNNVFTDLSDLDILNLDHNQIYYIQSDAFAGMIHLKYLHLNYNQLKKLENRMFRHLISLKILYIQHNEIFEIHQNAFSNLSNLTYLYLNNNSISYLVQYNFKPLTGLVDLQLRSNKLKEIQTSSFNGLKNLRSLYLGDNQISAVKPYGFIGLDSLQVLELVGNKFERIDFFYFSIIERLSWLWLNENRISNFSIDYKSQAQRSLELLDLSRNNLTSFDYESVYKKMPNLRTIFVGNNTFECGFFTRMYDFLSSVNVSVCTTSCSKDFTEMYNEECVVVYHVNETRDEVEVPTDFSTDCCTHVVTVNSCILFLALIVSSFC